MSQHLELLNLLNRGRGFNFRSREVVSEPVRHYCGQACDVNPLLFGSTISIQPVTGFVFYTLIRIFRAKKVCEMQIKHVRYPSYLLLTWKMRFSCEARFIKRIYFIHRQWTTGERKRERKFSRVLSCLPHILPSRSANNNKSKERRKSSWNGF